MTEVLDELACYLLAGQPDTARDIVTEVREAEALGLGAAFISERYNKKEAGVLCGAAGAASERIRLLTAATNHNTRHVMVTAGLARTMQSLTGGRFSLGIGRGVPILQDTYGIDRITTAQMEDFVDIVRRLFRGEAEIRLTSREWAVFEALLSSRGRVLSKQVLEERLYAFDDAIEGNAVEVYVSRLRTKLGSSVIETRRGLGYLIP